MVYLTGEPVSRTRATWNKNDAEIVTGSVRNICPEPSLTQSRHSFVTLHTSGTSDDHVVAG